MREEGRGKRRWITGSGCLGVLAFFLLAGCNMLWRRILPEPGKSQVVCVEKGERLYFDLEEDVDAGYRWDFTCDDKDVEVTMDHGLPEGGHEGRELGTAEVRIRIHRGYDGPSAVHFFYKCVGKPIEKEFTISLFRRTGDFAFWK